MENKAIDQLLERYFEGETTLAEEATLRAYFASANVATAHRSYAKLFGYYAQSATEANDQPLLLPTPKRAQRFPRWLKLGLTAAILLGALRIAFITQPTAQTDLGTYQTPAEAMHVTQLALGYLSQEINKGVATVEYMNQFEESKNVIFK